MRAASLLLWSGLLGGCYSPNPPLGVPCTDSHECPEGQECDLLTNVCGYPTESRMFRDDSAAQFEGGALDGAVIESGGFVGPVPYFVQGVRLTGITGNRLAADVKTVTFDELAQITPTGRGVFRGVDIELGDGVPALLGFSSGDDITILVEGEIWLDTPGAYMFEFRGNDVGFLDVAAPGADFVRVGDAGTTSVLLPYTAPSAGWYRFRGAFADSMNFIEWELRYRLPGTGFVRGIPDDTVRARVGDLDGVIVDAWDEPWVAVLMGTGLTDKIDGLTFAGSPYGFNLGGGAYSVRYTAQFLVDMEGDYRFKLDTSQGHRAWLDGMQIANVYNGAAQVTTTPPMHVVAGWHDIVIDVVKTGGPMGRYSFTVESGPQFAGAGFPRDHLRPVSGRAARFNSGENGTYTDLVDGMTITRGIGLDLPAGITTLAIDSSFLVTHPLQAQLSVTLDPPAGANIVLLAAAALSGVGDYTQHNVIPTANAGTQFNFIVGDSLVDAMIGAIGWAAVTLTYSGGRPPYEAAASYTSTVRDLDMARFGAISWQMRQAPDDPIVSVRTCDEAMACDAEPWTQVTNGETPTAPPRKYFQYKVDIVSGVDVPASLDWIDLQYVGYIAP